MTEKSSDKSKKMKGKLNAILTLTIVMAMGVSSLGLTGCDEKTKEASSKNGIMVTDSLDNKTKKVDKVDNEIKKSDSKNEKEKNTKVEKNNTQDKHTASQINNTNSATTNNTNVPTSVHPSDSEKYFQDALFIGDSRMQGFMLYSGINATGYTEPGLDVNTVLTKPLIKSNGNRLTIPQALVTNQFGKIYIKLGMNELGWIYTDKFMNQYSTVIDKLKELQPGAIIYVEAILPVTASKDSKGTYINNNRIAEYNGLISKMAIDKGVKFIDASSAVTDANGFLYEEATTDGVHLNKKYCQLWYQYLIDHK